MFSGHDFYLPDLFLFSGRTYVSIAAVQGIMIEEINTGSMKELTKEMYRL